MTHTKPHTVLTLFDVNGSLTRDNEFRDVENETAYYCQVVKQSPLSTKIVRLPDWSRQPTRPHWETWTSWLYFTSNAEMMGYVKFGSGEPCDMQDYLCKKSVSSQ